MNRFLWMAMVLMTVWAAGEHRASAVPVNITGFVAQLTGLPHDQPDITIEVRSLGTNRLVATGKAEPDGSFNIPIDADRIPDNNVNLSITAAGTALLNGRRIAVRTNAAMIGLPGKIGENLIENAGPRYSLSIVLIVPAVEYAAPCYCVPRCGLFRGRCR